MRQKVFFIRGLPGTGKTTFSKILKSEYSNSVLINPDYLIYSVNFLKYKKKFSQEIRLKTVKYRYNLNKTVNALKKGKNVIWEQPWRKSENIELTIRNIIKFITNNNMMDENTALKDLILLIDIDFYVFQLNRNLDDLKKVRSNYFKKTIDNDNFETYASKYKPLNIDPCIKVINIEDFKFTNFENLFNTHATKAL